MPLELCWIESSSYIFQLLNQDLPGLREAFASIAPPVGEEGNEFERRPYIEYEDVYLHKAADNRDKNRLVCHTDAQQECLEVCNFRNKQDIIEDELADADLEVERLEA